MYDEAKKVEVKPDLTSVCCSLRYKFLLEPIKTYLAEGCDRTMSADTKVIANINKYWEGQQSYPFGFKGTTYKAPTAEAENRGRVLTGIPLIDDDEEVEVEFVGDMETEAAIKSLKDDKDSIKS